MYLLWIAVSIGKFLSRTYSVICSVGNIFLDSVGKYHTLITAGVEKRILSITVVIGIIWKFLLLIAISLEKYLSLIAVTMGNISH